jgi:ankyrin repeat protein
LLLSQLLLQALLAAGAEPDALNVSGAAPLHLAASKAALPAVQLLLASGADPNVRNAKGWGPVHVAASGGSLDVVLRLVAGESCTTFG